ncbi:MAG: type VI secretion system tip protein VgrG [Hyphomicrobiales bacterium]|nr:type VI secretion system tip protein VgrG [Hyphomicrobiales bacterium]
MADSNTIVTLTLDSLRSEIIEVLRVTGEERISAPFRFEVLFVHSDAVLPDEVLARPATLEVTIAPGDDSEKTLEVAGVVVETTSLDQVESGEYEHVVVIEPHLALLGLNQQNHVYGPASPVTVQKLVEDVLKGTSKSQSNTGADYPIYNFDFSFNLTEPQYPEKNFILQYFEDDFSFLSRQCEHYGIFYYIDPANKGEKIVFGDANSAFKDLGSDGDLPYQQPFSGTALSNFAITSFKTRKTVTSSKVHIRDYSPDRSELTLTADSDIDGNKRGVVAYYGDNFDTTESHDGALLAKVRAEEIKCRQVTYEGISNAPQLRPGTIFKISGHSDALDNKQYLVTSVSHSVAKAHASPSFPHSSAIAELKGYENRFTCVPMGAGASTFRPERVTPKPVVKGLMTAIVYGSTDGDRADIDDYGRYLIKINLDESGAPEDKSSDRVRKAEPYSGKGGMHFVLYKDTEVLLAFINGDPDRPVIIGTVTNNQLVSPVTSGNARQDVIDYGYGVKVVAGSSNR